MTPWRDDLDRIQKELEQARRDARTHFFDSLRQYLKGPSSPADHLFPSDFAERSPAYQCAWLESQIGQRETAIAEMDASPKRPLESWTAIFGSVLGGVSASQLRAQLTELKARLEEVKHPPKGPEPSAEERHQQKLAALDAALRAAEDYAVDLRREATEVLKDPALSDPRRRKLENEYNDKVRVAEENASRAKEDLRRFKFTKT